MVDDNDGDDEDGDDKDGEDKDNGAEQQNEGGAQQQRAAGLSTAVAAILIVLFCCVGYCSGCASMYYLCALKADQQHEKQEQDRRDRLAMMKIVTAKDLNGGTHRSSSPPPDLVVTDMARFEGEII
jgi:hypothetical protein